ncbi:MAG: glutamate--tRNA ligase family protein [Bdellovibrionota bacterium]
MQEIRVRFASSPTGFLDIGGARTALFNYLFAKKTGGKFVLRIEDADVERSEAVYTEDILKSLQWLGLNWDEGPVFQSQRLERYQAVCKQLVEQGHAYQEESSTVRFKVPSEKGVTSFNDLIRGLVATENKDINDFIIQHGNGSPASSLACVVDDHDGRITHVVREEKAADQMLQQLLLYKALGFEPPVFAHLPEILGPDKRRLAKRHGALSVNQYRSEGFLAQSLLNCLARLGWSHGDQEVFSKEELVELFSLEQLVNSNAVFNVDKLLRLNGHYIRDVPNEKLARLLLEDFLEDWNAWGRVSGLREKLVSASGLSLIELFKQKAKTLKELVSFLRPLFYDGELPLDEKVYSQWAKARLAGPLEHMLVELKHVLKDQQGILGQIGADPETLETLFRATADRFEMKLSELAQPTRFFVQGETNGPQLFDVMARLPWATVNQRILRYRDLLG